jgi:type VI secretion system secreted protein Hcp
MAYDAFLKLDGIKGESLDAKHKDEIDIESFSFGVTQAGTHGTGGGGGAGKVSVQDIHLTKVIDKSSPELLLACCNGKHVKEALFTVRKAGENPLEYLKIKLTDILVSGVQATGTGDEVLTEQVSLNFAKIQYQYQQQGADGKATGGPVIMGWDVKGNVKI